MGNSASGSAPSRSADPHFSPTTFSSCPFLRLASIEVQLVLQCLDADSKARMASVNKQLRHDAAVDFAWKQTPLLMTQHQLYYKNHPRRRIRSMAGGASSPGDAIVLRWRPTFADDVPMYRMLNAPSLFGVDAQQITNMEELRQLLRYSCSRDLRWLRLPRVVEQRKDKGARGIEIFFEAALFNTVSRFHQLHTLIMPHTHKEAQIRTLLQRIPPLLTELGCSVQVWSDHFAQLPFVPQLRRLQLFQGTFGEDGFSFPVAHLSHITSLQLNEFVYRASIQHTLASAFRGLLALRTITLPCVPHIEVLLQHAHCIPLLSLLQLQWRGLAKEEVIPLSLSCPSLLSLRQLLQQALRLHIHFVRLRGRSAEAAKSAGLKGLFSSRSSPAMFTSAAVKELLRTNHVAFHLGEALEQEHV
jgi:hypothetical protein